MKFFIRTKVGLNICGNSIAKSYGIAECDIKQLEANVTQLNNNIRVWFLVKYHNISSDFIAQAEFNCVW